MITCVIVILFTAQKRVHISTMRTSMFNSGTNIAKAKYLLTKKSDKS